MPGTQLLAHGEKHELQSVPVAPLAPRLNLGSFMDLLPPPWENSDILPIGAQVPQGYLFKVIDCTQPLPYPNDYASHVWWSHVCEHISIEQTAACLREIYRVLKPGGVLRIATPDLQRVIHAYLNKQMDQFGGDQTPQYNMARTQGEKVARLIYPGHVAIYDLETLGLMMAEASFKNISRVGPGVSCTEVFKTPPFKDTHAAVSLICEGMKL